MISSEMSAFKLIRRANISREEKMIMLTGMNCIILIKMTSKLEGHSKVVVLLLLIHCLLSRPLFEGVLCLVLFLLLITLCPGGDQGS